MSGRGAAASGRPSGLLVATIRTAAPRALAIVTRRTGDFADAEDAVQEALAAAAGQWPRDGIPDDPVAWLTTVALRRWVDAVRADVARRERERRVVALDVETSPSAIDDTLALFLICCHPALGRGSQVALTLRALGGLTTREIARGLLVSESTVAQRISRAKATLRALDSTHRFSGPDDDETGDAVRAVLDVIGIIHVESHSATDGDVVTRPTLGAEALRLARELLARTPDDAPWRGEVAGLVALILLTDARAPARLDAVGGLVPLTEQDRSLWRADLIAEGVALLEDVLPRFPLGPFQLRAAIAAVHDEAPSTADTDWRELLGLYDLLRRVDPGPVVDLARLVVVAEVAGPEIALAAMDDGVAREAAPSRRAAVRAHLLERAGRREEAAGAAARAAELAGTEPERVWWRARAVVLTRPAPARDAPER